MKSFGKLKSRLLSFSSKTMDEYVQFKWVSVISSKNALKDEDRPYIHVGEKNR